MKNIRLALILTLICIPIFLLISCGGEQQTGVTDDEIVIGSWAPLEGPAALWGTVARGMDAYFKMINDEGGIHGRKIRFIYRNDGYEPARTVSVVRQMVQSDQVFMFAGGIGTAPGMAVKNYILERNIPWVSPASGSTHWAYPPNKYLFSTYPIYSEEAAVQVNYLVEEMGLSKIAVIYQNDDYGKGGLIGAELALEKHGLEVVTSVSTQIMDTDLNSHVARLSDSGAEAVLLWVLPRQAAITLGTAAVRGFRPQWVASSTLSDMALMYDITDGGWENVIFSSFGGFSETNPELFEKYEQAFATYHPDVRWGTFAASGFLFAEPVVEALKRAGENLTRETFVEAMESLENFEGSGPEITFGPENRQGSRSTYLIKCISATEYETLTEFRTADIDVNEAIRRLGL